LLPELSLKPTWLCRFVSFWALTSLNSSGVVPVEDSSDPSSISSRPTNRQRGRNPRNTPAKQEPGPERHSPCTEQADHAGRQEEAGTSHSHPGSPRFTSGGSLNVGDAEGDRSRRAHRREGKQPDGLDQTAAPGWPFSGPRAGPGACAGWAAPAATRTRRAPRPLNRRWPGCHHPQTPAAGRQQHGRCRSRPRQAIRRRQGKRVGALFAGAALAARSPASAGRPSIGGWPSIPWTSGIQCWRA